MPVHQAQLLYGALKDKGIEVKFHIVKDAGHGVGGREVILIVEIDVDSQFPAQSPLVGERTGNVKFVVLDVSQT